MAPPRPESRLCVILPLAILGVLSPAEALAPFGTKESLAIWRGAEDVFAEAGVDAEPTRRYCPQRQDHFDSANTKTWNQAYYVNDTFWKGPGSKAPVFVCVGGEGPPLTPRVVRDSVHCSNAVDWVQETGALMFAVEHRYYGCHNASACPVDNFDSSDSLRFLSSRQALADLASFHAHATQAYSLTSANKWISWGGSYPGMLAGWFRVKYPELVFASVASSAPVHAKVEMNEYNDWVRYAYTVESVGGSEACAQAIADGHATILSLMQTQAGRERLYHTFEGLPSADWLKSKSNQASFAGEGVAEFPSQSNDPSCSQPGCNIQKICEILTSSSSKEDNNELQDNVALLAKLRKIQNSQERTPKSNSSGSSRSVSAYGYYSQLKRQWTDFWGYQTCTEFGFYQTCDKGSKCPYSQGLDVLSNQLAMCRDEYNISAEQVAQNVRNSNEYYGGLSPDSTRIMWPNGEVDPWSQLSILKSPSPELPTLWVLGASHHAWTHIPQQTDQESVVEARKIIREQVKKWLDSSELEGNSNPYVVSSPESRSFEL